MQESIWEWVSAYRFNLSFTLIILLAYVIFRAMIAPKIRSRAEHGRLKESATSKALSALNILLVIGVVASSMVVWGFDFRGLLALSASIVAVTGVALFAGWSILSNITAFFLLLAHKSFRRGNFIRVIDGDNYIEGYVSEINLFNTKLITEEREFIIYPNNLIVARPTLVNPRNRLYTIGKITQVEQAKEDVPPAEQKKALKSETP